MNFECHRDLVGGGAAWVVGIVLALAGGRAAEAETIVSLKTPDEAQKALEAVRAGPKVEALATKTFTSADGFKGKYTLYGPLSPDAGRKYPLVLSYGDVGADAFRLQEKQREYPCFVLTIDGGPGPNDMPENDKRGWKAIAAAMAKEVLDKVLSQHNVDEKRLYVTGMSAGGGVAWTIALSYPETFAAVVPCYATCRELDKAPLLVKHNVAVWIFHGAASNLVRPDQDNGPRAWVAAIEKAGGRPRYTEYKLLGHTAAGYCEPALWPWLFSQKRP